MNEQQVNETIPSWIINHDENKIFIAIYISLAVILSIALGLFWLCLVVAGHYVFELIRQYSQHKNLIRSSLVGLWEIKLDIFLVLFAFIISIYMDVILGVAGLSAGTRAVATAGARFAGWQRIIRVILLSIDDLAQIFKAVGKSLSDKYVKKKHVSKTQAAKTESQADQPISTEVSPDKLSKGDIVSLSFGAICLLLILCAPLLTDHSMTDVLKIILEDLRPFPSAD